IEIGRGNLADRLLHDARAERVGAPDFKHMLASGEHPSDEFIAGKRKKRALGVLIPGLVDHQPETRNAVLLFHVVEQRILRLLCLAGLTHRTILMSGSGRYGTLMGQLTTVTAQPSDIARVNARKPPD